MNASAPALRHDETPPMVTLRTELEQRANEFRMVLPEHISPAKFQRTLLTAVQLNPDLLACNRRSFLTSCMKAAQDGLLPDGREAAIVPFKTRVKDKERGWQEVRLAQYLPMVFGLRKKILQSAEVSDLFAGIVYRQEIAGGFFHYEEGSERALRHRPIIDPDFAPSDDDIALAYSVATFVDGTKSFEVMRRWEIERVREASQTGAAFDKNGNPREAKGPWREWFAEMAKKTVIRRHSKSLPQSGDVIVRDIESEDMGLAAAKATVALLDSRPGETPQPLGEAPFDPETGEVDSVGGPDYVEPEIAPPTELNPDDDAPELTPELAAKGQVMRGGKPVEAEPEPEPVEEPEPDDDDAAFDEPAPDDDPEPERDAEANARELALANSYIDRAKACQTIIDLNALKKEAEMDLAGMDPANAIPVDNEFVNAARRLAPAKAKETA